MYVVLFVSSDGKKGLVTDSGAPALFPDQQAAYGFIETTMAQPEHPKFMWLRRLDNANPG